MDSLTLGLVALLLACIFIFLSQRNKKPQGMPPGPTGLPLLGNILSILPRDYMAYTRWKKYGDVMTVYAGPAPLVVLNSYRAIHEAFVGQADVFAGRFTADYFDLMSRKSGILLTEGPLWQEHRRFTIRMLRDFGLGRELGETIVREESEALVSKLEAGEGGETHTQEVFTSIINNVIARLTFGERTGSEDPHFSQFTQHLEDTLNFQLIDSLPIIFPFIIKVPPLLRVVEYFSQVRMKTDIMHNYIVEKIESRRGNLPDDLSQASNLCEAFLIEQARQEESNPGQHTFTEWQLIRNMFELFLAGTETTATTLTWAVLLLAIHRDVQRRMQQEIEEQVGRDRTPAMSDLKQLPYVHAVMDEVMRYSTLVPSGVGHRTMQDTELMGFFIPKKTLITSNLFAVHRDPELWARPYDFHPEHFLTADGDYQSSKYLIPFSIGKRACLGESLARMEFFIVLTAMMQHFEVRLADNTADVDAILFGKPGSVRRPLEHSIVFSKLKS